jgi:hypothetical protein
MKYLLALVLLVGCGKVNAKDNVNILINMKDVNYTATAHALTQLQIQSKNMKIAFGTWDNHQIIVDYARNDQVDNLFRAYILGVAWIDEVPCRIQMVERTYYYGQDWVNSVLWHEIGHCLGMDHHPNEEDIMYKYAKPLPKYKQSALQEFFRRLYEATR